MDDAEYVKRCRHKLGLSINKFADLLGKKSSHTIRKWENGGEVQRTDLIAMTMILMNTFDVDPIYRTKDYYDNYLWELFDACEKYIQKDPCPRSVPSGSQRDSRAGKALSAA